jgi:hypothetical protein
MRKVLIVIYVNVVPCRKSIWWREALQTGEERKGMTWIRNTIRKEGFHTNPIISKYFDPRLVGSFVPVSNTNRD